MSKYLFFGFFLTSLTIFLGAQELRFEAKADKTEVNVNEQFVVRFMLTYGQNNISVDQPLKLPDFGGLHPLAQSKFDNFQFTNGKVVNQSGMEVALVADKEGEYNIGSAVIMIDGKRFETKPIQITVKKVQHAQPQGGKRMQGAFLTAEVSQENPFINQEVILKIKVYARDYSIINRLRNFKEPGFENLTAKLVNEDIPDSERQVLVNGRTYISKELVRYILYPQKSGEIHIDPFELTVVIANYYGGENIQLTTDPVTLNVKPLPKGKPWNFSGAVGDFTMNTSISKETAKANEAVNLDVEIIGAGNLNTMKLPAIDLPDGIEGYSPKQRDAYDTRPTGTKGKIVESRVLVPQYGGNYKIGPVSFNFFDPVKEEFVTLKSDAFLLKVSGPKPPAKDTTVVAEPPKDEEKPASDYAINDTLTEKTFKFPIIINEAKEKVTQSVESGKGWVWGLGGLAALIFAGVFLLTRRKKTNNNPENLNQKAKDAQFKAEISEKMKKLKAAAQAKDSTLFLSLQEEILTEIGMYFSGTRFSEFTEIEVDEKLTQSFGELADRWKSLLLECKQFKYAFGDSGANLDEMYTATLNVWKSFQKQGFK